MIILWFFSPISSDRIVLSLRKHGHSTRVYVRVLCSPGEFRFVYLSINGLAGSCTCHAKTYHGFRDLVDCTIHWLRSTPFRCSIAFDGLGYVHCSFVYSCQLAEKEEEHDPKSSRREATGNKNESRKKERAIDERDATFQKNWQTFV